MKLTTETAARRYAAQLGARLREIRRERGWTLQEAADTSDGTFSEAALGAYERAERALTVVRLCFLAELYSVPVADLLPDVSSDDHGSV